MYSRIWTELDDIWDTAALRKSAYKALVKSLEGVHCHLGCFTFLPSIKPELQMFEVVK